jgi:predicted membrane chloride channel (bestrophin family)
VGKEMYLKNITARINLFFGGSQIPIVDKTPYGIACYPVVIIFLEPHLQLTHIEDRLAILLIQLFISFLAFRKNGSGERSFSPS